MIASPNRSTGGSCSSESKEESSNRCHLPFAEIFASDCIVSLPPSIDKAEAIRCLVNSLVNHQCLDRQQADVVSRQIIQRESYGSSAIGKGLAFPHLRTLEVENFVGAIGVAPDGIDFDSLDREPTKLAFLTLSPIVCREQHIHLLSRLVRLMTNKAVRLQLSHLITPQDVYRYLRDIDSQSGMFKNPS